jgi:hypothetical protein
MEEMRSTYKSLVRKSGGQRLLGRYRRGWEDNIRLGFGEIEWEILN